MSIEMSTPGVEDLASVMEVLSSWQHDSGPLHLHPGDLGFYSMRGADATAAAIRSWSSGGKILALGLLDGADLLRMAIDPDLRDDEELARQIAADVNDPGRGVLSVGDATVEARGAERLSRLLSELEWEEDEPWTPFHHDLSDLVGDAGLNGVAVRVETIELVDRADIFAPVHWSAFRGLPFTEEDRVVAVATVWSAGPGRPGLLEPMGVHLDHRGHGYGVAITRAAASALREMGSSSAVVCAESSNVAAASTYVAAGFTAGQQVTDMHRSA